MLRRAGEYYRPIFSSGRDIPKALGLSVDEWVKDRLGGYVKMSVAEGTGIALELKAEGYSNVAAAEILGVDEKMIRNYTSENSDVENKNSNKNNRGHETASENSEPAPIDAMAALAAIPGQESAKA
jgi:hypothetical protein